MAQESMVVAGELYYILVAPIAHAKLKLLSTEFVNDEEGSFKVKQLCRLLFADLHKSESYTQFNPFQTH